MSPVYRSPHSGTAAAVTAPARIAEEFRGVALWRQHASGEIEVATVRNGVLELQRVHDDGSATLVASSPAARPAWAKVAVIAGLVPTFGVLPLFMLANWVGAPISVSLAVFFGGMALMMIGGIVLNRGELASRVARELGTTPEWHVPTNLHRWMPQTSAQLASVERIADDHDGLAFVLDSGERAVQVCTFAKRWRKHYRVDERGSAEFAGEERVFRKRPPDDGRRWIAILTRVPDPD